MVENKRRGTAFFFRRKPRDIVTIEKYMSGATNRSRDTTRPDGSNTSDMAMTSYLEARQRADLRIYICSSTFPERRSFFFHLGDRVYYCQSDRSKLNTALLLDVDTRQGSYRKTELFCVIGTGSTVFSG